MVFSMNVDEAMAKWKELREQYDWPKYSPTLTDIFVAEVERLRAELAKENASAEVIISENELLRLTNQKLATELAAAKAATL